VTTLRLRDCVSGSTDGSPIDLLAVTLRRRDRGEWIT
jgi:hypothetical protein